ncbi:hypothetical protein [Stieleria varia]|uniref:AAA+ ATPase domain-containing protein n=1 Tax=Stieleria varia TaxID=2528005 RepID=A0A5C6A5G8_9BACT|nr:hypothetical protein [Stieleria varia]TWT94635.1 hypothetical protein Pla52n_54560 [Stieleria varia]
MACEAMRGGGIIYAHPSHHDSDSTTHMTRGTSTTIESPPLTSNRWIGAPAQRWASHNLSRNPFGELTRQERIELAVVDVQAVAQFISQPRRAYQFIGECGRGKTTRMLAITRHIPDATYAYLPEDEPCPPIAAGSVVMIDEAQRMPRRIRQAVFASGLPLVLATHRNLSGPLRRAGYTVQTERIGLQLSDSLLQQILNQRIHASRRDTEASVPEISLADCRALIRRFGTDVRAMESYLYDIVQQQVNSHGKMRFIDHLG